MMKAQAGKSLIAVAQLIAGDKNIVHRRLPILLKIGNLRRLEFA
jgi:hypothetical protein